MAVELSAVRLLAPWFGASAAVWTNVIGVVLAALALGYLVGARAAAGPSPAARLAGLLALGGAVVVALPVLAAPVAELFLPAGLALEQAAGLAAWGSLASAGMLFLAPGVLLGAVGPLAVELVEQKSGVHAGTAGGRVRCVSTLGSLAGTFATTHLLVPGLGTRRTLVGAGLMQLASGTLLALAIPRRPTAGPGRSLAVAWLAAGAALLAPARGRAPAAGERLLEETESAYQHLRVVERDAGLVTERLLQVNEGLDSFQSVWRGQAGLLGPGYYYDYLALPLAWPGPERRRVLVLGLAAGTVFRVIEGAAPAGLELELTGLELDRRALELGRRWFELAENERANGRARTRAVVADARVGLAAAGGPFDLVVLDCYANQSEIPAHLATREFFAAVRERLAPGGVLAVNVGGFGASDPVVAAVGATLAAAFGDRVLGARVPNARNWVLYAFAGEVVDPLERRGSAESALDQLLPPLTLPGALARFDGASGPCLTDDRAPLDRLERASLRAGRARLAGDV
jgi:predicted membrane-bound spermidine synthase